MASILTYKDLARDDIALLTEVLGRPARGHHASVRSSTSTAEAQIATLIADLPPRLKSKVPCMAPGCPRHKRINLAPLDDLAREFRHEATHYVPTIWEPLEERGSFDAEQRHLLGAVRGITTLHLGSCSACWLEYAGLNDNASVALGAFIIGRVSPGIYRRSKRLVWIEDLLRRTLGEREAERAIRRMWNAGVEFRRVRKASSVEAGEGRGYVGEYVRRARELEFALDPVQESTRSVSEESVRSKASTVVRPASVEEDFEELLCEDEHSPPAHKIPRKPVPQATRPPPNRVEAKDHVEADEAQPERIGSSIYSRHESINSLHRRDTPRVSRRQDSPHLPQRQTESPSPSSGWNSSTRPSSTDSSTGTQIIDLYRHSVFPDNANFDARSSTDSRKRSPIYPFGRESPESVRSQPVTRAGTPLEDRTVFPEPLNSVSIRQRREEAKGRKVLPIGGHPRVYTKNLDRRGL